MKLQRHAPGRRGGVWYVRAAPAHRKPGDHWTRFACKKRGTAEGTRLGGAYKIACSAKPFRMVSALALVYTEGAFKGIDHLRRSDRGCGGRRIGAHCRQGCGGRRQCQQRESDTSTERVRFHRWFSLD